MPRPLTVGRLVELVRETLELDQVGTGGLEREITSAEISGPGIVLAGYMERFVGNRLQVLGETEVSYLNSLPHESRVDILTRFLSFPIPALFITKGQTPPAGLTDIAAAAGVAVLISQLKTNEFYRRLWPVLEDLFAPTTTIHGSLADVFGVGLLFIGKSGIGKSECVLDLVERGHRLVADDLVIASRRGNDVLIGRGHELQRHFMEVRGIGLVDVRAIFGVRAVRQQKRIEVVVQLEEWDSEAVIDRTGLDGVTMTILDIPIPKITVPLNPGKNITVVAEVIAMNHLLRYSGINTAEAFNDRLIERMRRATDVQRYLAEDVE
ncbi:MAG TPA: HPr(Ser) kinase/phosphatase [Gemmatimonadaceae bacterium]|nr:HPr(Ser) kinase/phosphatase [Gemmatimonadaceae bacterium]